jgi:hypothetical protein
LTGFIDDLLRQIQYGRITPEEAQLSISKNFEFSQDQLFQFLETTEYGLSKSLYRMNHIVALREQVSSEQMTPFQGFVCFFNL